ncbi:MAG TPA: hypothetical protein ENI66_01700, partial [Candidatus Yonathbacteria bacterium]|nr:hypothetical protein [Candidatus Yonathbacteria bacterium]
MKILSIETSCDETATCILNVKDMVEPVEFNVLANITLSQAKLHAEYGGVFPNLAKREHSKNLVPVLKEVLKKSGLEESTKKPLSSEQIKSLEELLTREPSILEGLSKYLPTIEKPEIDVIAVTSGPGLEPALWVGINFAKALSIIWGIPVIPINHMEGHLLASLAKQEAGSENFAIPEFKFPVLALLISG